MFHVQMFKNANSRTISRSPPTARPAATAWNPTSAQGNRREMVGV